MDAIKDLWDSIRLNLLDRLGNPLVGAFGLAWSIWNFRILLVAFGEGGWKPKIEYLDQRLMPAWSDWLVHGYLIPLVFALTWVFVFPSLFRRVMVFHRKQAAKTARAVMIADGIQPISAEEASQLRLRMRELGEDWSQERATYLKQNDELSQRIASLTELASKQPPHSSESAPVSALPVVESSQPTDSPDQLVSTVANLQSDQAGEPIWPILLGDRDLHQLPSSVVAKVRGHHFQNEEIQALIAMRNWPRVDKRALASALNIEPFDAQVILDRLKNLGLLNHGTEGAYMNADGRIITSFFKRVFEDSSKSQ